MASFNDGFYHYYQKQIFCDTEFVHGEKCYKLHQLILVNVSLILADAIEFAKTHFSTPSSAESQELLKPIDLIYGDTHLRVDKISTNPWRGHLRIKLFSTVDDKLFSAFLPELIDFMYKGHSVSINLDNVVDWFCISEILQIVTLKTQVVDWLTSNISKSNLFRVLSYSISEPRSHEVVKYLLSIIARNFSEFVEADRFQRQMKSINSNRSSSSVSSSSQTLKKESSQVSSSSASSSHTESFNDLESLPSFKQAPTLHFDFDFDVLPLETMIELLHDKDLFVVTENDVLQAILAFLQRFQVGDIPNQQLLALFETLRFERLDYATLESALAHPLVPKELLSRALMQRLAGFEKPSSPLNSNLASSSEDAPNSIIQVSPPCSPTSTPIKHSLENKINQNNSFHLSQTDPSSSSIETSTSCNSLLYHPLRKYLPFFSFPDPAMVPLIRKIADKMENDTNQTQSSTPMIKTPSISIHNIPTVQSSPSSVQSAPFNSNTLSTGQLLARDRRRQSYGRLFQWSSDFDTKGVLYYLATKEYRSEWSNPSLQKIVDITWSSLDKGKPFNILDREATECWTQDVPSSWFLIDLGVGKSLRISAYTLRHGSATKQDFIRNWTLKGSSDGNEFITLMRHKNDESLAVPFATHTWNITGSTQAYRYFKVVQTGHNSSKHNFLSICGIEFYGELIYDAPPKNVI